MTCTCRHMLPMCSQGVQGGFLQLVLELTAVEVQVLLKDALRGSAMLQASSDTVVQCAPLVAKGCTQGFGMYKG